MAELEPLPNEFPDNMESIQPNPEDIHIMEGPDPSGNNFLDFSQSFSNGPIMGDSIEDDSNIFGDETTNPFGDETTLPDETRGSINISQYSHVSQGSLHPSDLQGGKRRKKRKTSKRKNKKSTRKNINIKNNKNTKKKMKNNKKKTKKNKISKSNNLKKVRKQTRSKK